MTLTHKRMHLTKADAVIVTIIETSVPFLAATRQVLERFEVICGRRYATAPSSLAVLLVLLSLRRLAKVMRMICVRSQIGCQ